MDKRYFKDWTCLPFVGQGGLGSGCLVVDAVGVHPVVEVEPWDDQIIRWSDVRCKM